MLVELLACIVSLYLMFKDIVKLFSKVTVQLQHSHQQCRKVPVSPCPWKYLLSFVFFIIAIL